jgi:hypothetical protein
MEKYLTGKVTRPALEQRVLTFRRSLAHGTKR